MSVRSTIFAAAAASVLLLGSASALAATSPGSKSDSASCFLTEQWSGWKSPSPNVIYLRIGISSIYRLDLSAGSDELSDPDMHLTSVVRGSDSICSPLDLQLEVVDLHGAFREPLIVKTITKLTPDEVAAIPKKYLP